MHPHLDLVEQLIRMFGWPALLGVIVWAARTYDSGQRELKQMSANTTLAVAGVEEVKVQVTALQTNHLAHLQSSIEQVAKSNDVAVDVLREISTGIAVLTDRFPRA